MQEIEVVDYSVNGATGHIDVTVCAVCDEPSTRGPIRVYGIDATQLKVQYNGDIGQWLQKVKLEHQAHHGLHDTAIDALALMKGKRI